nr:VENN motif pre-toxin domain-containing protein [Acinetobacter soli]
MEKRPKTLQQSRNLRSVLLSVWQAQATTGDVATKVQSGQVAQNAVENNFLSVKEAARKNALIYNL